MKTKDVTSNDNDEAGLNVLPSHNCGSITAASNKEVLFSFKEFTEEVLHSLLAMNTKKSMGEDQLDPSLIRLTAPLIAEPIAHIFLIYLFLLGVFLMSRKLHMF